jgi:hypothetical protein
VFLLLTTLLSAATLYILGISISKLSICQFDSLIYPDLDSHCYYIVHICAKDENNSPLDMNDVVTPPPNNCGMQKGLLFAFSPLCPISRRLPSMSSTRANGGKKASPSHGIVNCPRGGASLSSIVSVFEITWFVFVFLAIRPSASTP